MSDGDVKPPKPAVVSKISLGFLSGVFRPAGY